nr:glucose PTS transporter subunit EIIB [Neobacillus notoginsengisoli]
MKTPGREDSKDALKLYTKIDYITQKEAAVADEPVHKAQIQGIIDALGGKENINYITNCATRLRVEVKDESQVEGDEKWVNDLDAKGVVRSGKSLQIIYGAHVITLAAQVKDALDME